MQFAGRQQFSPDTAIANIAEVSWSQAVANAAKATATLFVTPEHDRLHQPAEGIASTLEPQPVAEAVTIEVEDMDLVLAANRVVAPSTISGPRLVQLGAILIQFTDYIPDFRTSIRVPYEEIAGLRGGLAERAAATGPLGFADQLDVALSQTEGDITESLWRLFVGTRLHARWLDSSIVDGMPDYSREEKLDRMIEWRESIVACKAKEQGLGQDTTGDAYYMWTHALAKYSLGLSDQRRQRVFRSLPSKAFHNGTELMHVLIHSHNKQAIKSDHRRAALLGNTIGVLCLDYARTAKDTKARQVLIRPEPLQEALTAA